MRTFFTKKLKIQLLTLLFVGVCGFFVVPSGEVQAQGAAFDRDRAIYLCNTVKLEKARCLEEVDKCAVDDQACYRKAPRAGGGNVYLVCRETSNPQACHRTARDACKGAENVGNCRKEVATRGSFAAGAAGGATSASSDSELFVDAGRDFVDTCGSGPNKVETSFNFGCSGKGNPIVDMVYALVKFLTYGVGIVLAASIIYAGIMYSTSGGNPEQTQAAKKRILNAMIGLIFYLLIFAMVQFLVPGGLFTT